MTSFTGHAFERSDVSILLPLPEKDQWGEALSPASTGDRGPLLPEPIQAGLPSLVASMNAKDVYASSLRVVAVRLDPCFREGTEKGVCRPQIRMVWQPLKNETRIVTTKDAAIHTFYDLSEQDWRTFLIQYRGFVKKYPSVRGAPLALNSNFVAGSLKGPYWQELKALLLKFCGEKSLGRVTLMSLDFSETQWVFRGYEVDHTTASPTMPPQLRPIQIATIHAAGQVVSVLSLGRLDFRTTIFPFGQSEVGLWLYDNSLTVAAHFKEEPIRDFIRQQVEIENPLKHNPGTVDCASCHLSATTVNWARRNYPAWDWATLAAQAGGQDQVLMTSTPPVETHQLRAFGYFEREPVISPRVVNETDQVLKSLNGEL